MRRGIKKATGNTGFGGTVVKNGDVAMEISLVVIIYS
jgi:hypothetical protein